MKVDIHRVTIVLSPSCSLVIPRYIGIYPQLVPSLVHSKIHYLLIHVALVRYLRVSFTS